MHMRCWIEEETPHVQCIGILIYQICSGLGVVAGQSQNDPGVGYKSRNPLIQVERTERWCVGDGEEGVSSEIVVNLDCDSCRCQ